MSGAVGSPPTGRPSAWLATANLLGRWLERRERIDTLLDTLPPGLSGPERARCQHLVFGVVRHYGRLDAALGRLIAHPPRFSTRAVLFIAGFEVIEAAGGDDATGRIARTVHHAVEQTKTLASPAEARLVNAVVRKLIPVLATPPPAATAEPAVLAEYFSHPEWLVRFWLAQFGAEATRALLEWNQQPATVYARWRAGADEPIPGFLKPTAWAGFFEVASGRWTDVEPLLKSGKIYVQDPGTRLAVELLAPQAGETVLDLCAAPGGKSLMIADAMKLGQVVAMDLPIEPGKSGARIDRLAQNLSRASGVEVAVVQADLLKNPEMSLREHKLPASFAAVLLDAPCSNTGVMRHRADVKWRLQAGDFKKHPKQQLALLHAASRLVAPGGRLVYSTCSIDAEENERVVAEFFNSRAGGPFKLEASVIGFPWVTGHDGAAAFLLRRGS
ncbi:MAG: RNA methyltransferase [Opitutus sp.]|nr:RNA methyltransferase [Opitutus sp.]